jgi:hypothetical protein
VSGSRRWDPDLDTYATGNHVPGSTYSPGGDGRPASGLDRADHDSVPYVVAGGVEVAGVGPLLLAAAAGAVMATGLGVLVLLLNGFLVALVAGGLVLLAAAAIGTSYLRGAR